MRRVKSCDCLKCPECIAACPAKALCWPRKSRTGITRLIRSSSRVFRPSAIRRTLQSLRRLCTLSLLFFADSNPNFSLDGHRQKDIMIIAFTGGPREIRRISGLVESAGFPRLLSSKSQRDFRGDLVLEISLKFQRAKGNRRRRRV